MSRCIFFVLILFVFKETEGTDPFEDVFSTRFECYGTEQPGCSTDFIDVHPEFSMGSNGITKADTFMYLFTPNNKDVPELLHKCPDGLPPKSLFNPKCRTDIIMPGYVSGICIMAAFRELKNEMLKKGCYNMILIDWMWGNSADAKDAVNNGKVVGKQVAALVKILKEKFNLSHKSFSCTGHSLGAVVCGFIGQETHIAIINALEPCGVLVSGKDPLDDRLDPGDADCVQVFHTNMGPCLPFFGTENTLGTVDIYFNGGKVQEATSEQTRNAFLTGDFAFGLCSLATGYHLQALQYYKASINADDCQFIAVKCRNYKDFKQGKCASCGKNGENCILVGPDCCDCLNSCFLKTKRTRKYYLDTDATCPYCNNSKVDISGFHCKKNSLAV